MAIAKLQVNTMKEEKKCIIKVPLQQNKLRSVLQTNVYTG